jgi:hypothetical protein
MKSTGILLALIISLPTFGQIKNQNNLIFVSEFSYKYSPQKPTPPRVIFHNSPIINLIGIGVSKEVQDTFWLFNDSDDTLLITNIESVYLKYFQITNKLLPKQKTPLVFKASLQNNEYDFTTNTYYATITLSNNAKLFCNIVIPTISNNMFVVYKDDGVNINYAISKQKNHIYNLVVFFNQKGGLLAKGLVRNEDTTQKVGDWIWTKDGYETLKIIQYSKSISLSAFDKNIEKPHTNFSIKILEKGQWKEPIVDIIDKEKRIFITSKTDSIAAYTDSSSYRFKLNYKSLFPHTSKQFFLLKPYENFIPIKKYDIPFTLHRDAYTIVLDNKIALRNNIEKLEKYHFLMDKYLEKYPKLNRTSYNSFNLQALSTKEKKQLLQEINNDSLITLTSNLFYFPFSKDESFCENRVYINVDENKLNKCKRTMQRLGFSFSKNENGEVDYWYIVYKHKIVDEAFFEAYKKIAKKYFVNKLSLDITTDDATNNQLNKL